MAKRKHREWCVTVYMDGGQATVFVYDELEENNEMFLLRHNNHLVGRFFKSKVIGFKEVEITEEDAADVATND
jgi:hypothetical protein